MGCGWLPRLHITLSSLLAPIPARPMPASPNPTPFRLSHNTTTNTNPHFLPLAIPIANPQPLPLRLRHCSSPCLALPSCVVFSAAAHLVLPNYPVVGHGRSGPVHDCLQHQHPGIVHQARWEVGTD